MKYRVFLKDGKKKSLSCYHINFLESISKKLNVIQDIIKTTNALEYTIIELIGIENLLNKITVNVLQKNDEVNESEFQKEDTGKLSNVEQNEEIAENSLSNADDEEVVKAVHHILNRSASPPAGSLRNRNILFLYIK